MQAAADWGEWGVVDACRYLSVWLGILIENPWQMVASGNAILSDLTRKVSLHVSLLAHVGIVTQQRAVRQRHFGKAVPECPEIKGSRRRICLETVFIGGTIPLSTRSQHSVEGTFDCRTAV